MKTIWLTCLSSSEDQIKGLASQLSRYGLDVKGHLWEDDLEKIAWIKPRGELLDPKVHLWAIMASEEDLMTPTLRYGLSLLAVTVQARRGLSFPILVFLTEGELSPSGLPTCLAAAEIITTSAPGFGAKVVARMHSPRKSTPPEYRLDSYGNEQIGQWFEVGPNHGPWLGAMFGVTGAEVAFHAVGPKGSLPSSSTLNYPQKGLKLELGDKEYTAWAVQNELDLQSSYFVKVEGFPETVIFGSYSEEKEAELFVVKLK